MKRITGCIMVAILTLTLCSCNKASDGGNIADADPFISLETASQCDTIQFDATHVEIDIFSDENYYFSNRNEDFYKKFTNFLKDTKFSPKQVDSAKGDHFSFSICDGSKYASFSIYENDVICGSSGSKYSYYYCKGVYNKFVETFDVFLKENQKYCRSASTPIRQQYEYAVFDKKNYVMESDYISRPPNLYYDSGIVHMWVQTGTGVITRWAKFFDVENTLTSPTYYGQTDYFGDMVCATGASKVIVYDMFSGEELYVFDQFEKPLGHSVEGVLSAYFSKDGSSIIVEYINTEYKTETQIFELPKN